MRHRSKVVAAVALSLLAGCHLTYDVKDTYSDTTEKNPVGIEDQGLVASVASTSDGGVRFFAARKNAPRVEIVTTKPREVDYRLWYDYTHTELVEGEFRHFERYGSITALWFFKLTWAAEGGIPDKLFYAPLILLPLTATVDVLAFSFSAPFVGIAGATEDTEAKTERKTELGQSTEEPCDLELRDEATGKSLRRAADEKGHAFSIAELARAGMRSATLVVANGSDTTTVALPPEQAALLAQEFARCQEPADLALQPLDPPFQDEGLPGLAADRVLDAGESGTIRIAVQNRGKGFALGARLVVEAPASVKATVPELSELSPGETRELAVPVRADDALPDGEVTISLRVEEARGFASAPLRLRVPSSRLRKPALSIGELALRDGSAGRARGNGDGRADAGETLELVVPIKNGGEGPSAATVRVVSSQGTLEKSEEQLEVRAGASERAVLVLALPRTASGAASIAVTVEDGRGFQKIERSFDVAIHARTPSLVVASARVQDASGQQLRALVRGRPQDVLLVLENRGDGAAESVKVGLAAAEEVAVRTEPREVGSLPPGARSEPLAFRVEVRVGAKVAPGVRVSQSDFGDTLLETGLEVVDESVEVVVGRRPSGNEPAEPPLVSIAEPQDGAHTASDTVRLVASASDRVGIERVSVRVNGAPHVARDVGGVRPATNSSEKEKEKAIVLTIPLAPGENTIVLEVEGAHGGRASHARRVFRDVAKGETHVVAIGIGAYKDDGIRRLDFAGADARSVAERLAKTLDVKKENVHVLLDQDATLVAIRELLLTDLPAAVKKSDTVVLYVAAHGAPERTGTDEEDGLEKFLLPHDAKLRSLAATALPMTEITGKVFRLLAADRVLLLLDTCFSGAAGGRTIVRSFRGATTNDYAKLAGKGRIVLAACGANQVAEERAALGHGLFTAHLLDALSGKAVDSDKDGIVSVDEVWSYVQDAVRRSSEGKQVPSRSGSFEGVFPLGRAP